MGDRANRGAEEEGAEQTYEQTEVLSPPLVTSLALREHAGREGGAPYWAEGENLVWRCPRLRGRLELMGALLDP